MPAVLFVCLANRCRSPLVAAFFAQCLQDAADRQDWSVTSAGTWTQAGLPVEPLTLQSGREWGLDLQAHRSRTVDAAMIAASDLVVVMETGQKEALQVEFPTERAKIYLLSEVAEGQSYSIPDPFGPGNVSHQEVTQELHNLVQRGFENIRKLALISSLKKGIVP